MTNVALIGLGMVADTHLAAIRDATSANLIGVLGRDKIKAQAFAKKATASIGQPVRLYQTIDELAHDDTLDFAIIATPPDARQQFVAKLVQAKKPILVEKPIERTLEAAQMIVELCENNALPLGVVLQHRARSASVELKNLIDAGELGEIAAVELRVPWWREQSYYDAPGRGTFARDGGGVLINQAIHTIDLAHWLLGPIEAVQAMLTTTPLHELEAEDWAGAVFRLRSGAVGTLVATTSAYPGDTESILISGTLGSARLHSGVVKIDFLDGTSKNLGAQASTGGGADPMAFTHDWHQSIIEDFTRCLGTNDTPIASGRSALMAQATIEAMSIASRSGQTTEVVEV
ncbi:MAG: Gfo/Idh/MocA family oxidoreductase [Pseudomonadota bacterium]